MTLDGVCDHTAVAADDDIHEHYGNLIQNADTILYGRITFELMVFWKDLMEKPSGEKSMNEFAAAMDGIHKIVFSRTLKSTDWKSAKLAERSLEDEVLALKQQKGRDILVGSRSLIVQLMNLGLLDELQLTIHPIVAGHGSLLFNQTLNRKDLKLTDTKIFGSGAITLYYMLKK